MKKTICLLSTIFIIIFGQFVLLVPNLKAQMVPEPIAYWNFNNGTEVNAGLISDTAGHYNSDNNNGTWVSNGYNGGAISFSCKGDNFTCSMKTPGLSAISKYTLLFRMKVGDISNANYSRVIFSAYESHAYIYGGLAGDVNERNKITTAQMGNFTVSDDNNWHHYAFIWGHDGKHYFYKDGVLAGYATGPGISNISSAFIFGMAGGLESDINPFVTLDEIKVYDQALTTAQITEEYNYNKLLCTSDAWNCGNWSSCSIDGQQTRSCNKTSSCEGGASSPATTQSCTYVPPCTSNDYSCNNWSACSQNGKQTRTCNKTTSCKGGISAPATTQSCTYVPACISFYYSSWSECTPDGKQTRNITSKYPSICEGGELPKITQSCTYTPACSADTWQCGSWGACSSQGTQSRTCNKKTTCEGGVSSPSTSQYCTYLPPCTEDFWECSAWGQCNANNQKTRTCTKTYDCSTANTPSPDTTQACNYIPPCNADKWECGSWGTCSPQGIQTRDCKKTYDCSSAETAPPASSQYCEPPNQPKPQTPSDDSKIINQDSIIKATVKLICPVSRTMASQGSGTVISSSGTILTNKHVINGTVGCLVGFIDDYDDEPYFGDRQIADIYKISSDANVDAAILKLRNPKNKILVWINIAQSNSSSIKLGEILTTYGYPAKFGTKITYTSGDFSGVDGNYLKTTAIIEHGNSGGGAYLKNGAFIGIPTAVVKGSLNSMGYLLSVNKVNSWLNNSPIAYDNGSSNNYSRVSILEDIDLNTLDTLDLFIPEETSEVKNQQIKLIKSSDNPTVFEIKDNQRRKIRSGREFLALGYKWSDIVELSPSEVMAYPLGDPVTVEIKLLKLAGNPTVYEVINGGQAKPFTNAQEFLGKGYKWSEIKIVDQSELSKYLSSDTAKQTSQTIEINTKALNLRAGPSAQDQKLGSTYQGEKYAVLESQNNWYKIEKNGLSGWVYGGYVK